MLPTPLPSIVFQQTDDGAVLFSPATEVYFGLNAVGARVWRLLPPASATLDDICNQLTTEYPDVAVETLRDDVAELLDQLTAEGLVSPSAVGETDARDTP